MLPRLRFVIAAALIAALPWLLLGGGVVTTAQNGAPIELSRPNTGLTLSAGDLREAQHMYILAYVRRSRELERLREMATAPLSEWIAAPAGVAEPDRPLQPEQKTEASAAQVASLPPEPASAEPAENDEPQSHQPDPDNTQQQPPPDQTAEPTSPSPAPEITGSISPRIALPLPRAKPMAHIKHRRVKRPSIARTRIAFRAQPRIAFHPQPPPLKPNPFSGPPATPTLINPPENYGAPQ
jgi:hypothetical protein